MPFGLKTCKFFPDLTPYILCKMQANGKKIEKNIGKIKQIAYRENLKMIFFYLRVIDAILRLLLKVCYYI